jgi:subtilase family serine protease
MQIDKYRPWLALAGLVLGGALPLGVRAAASPQQAPGYYPNVSQDTARINTAVKNSELVAVKNSQLSSALSKYDTGAMSPTAPIASLTLLLKRSDEKEGQFKGYLSELTKPGSPYFHHWLAPQQIGSMFGPATDDINKVKQWLASQGLAVKSVSPDGMMIRFSGSASAVGAAFHAPLHNFKMEGQQHFGSLAPQQIPLALSPVVQGVASLSNFFPKPQHMDVGTVQRDKKTGKWQTISKASTPSGKVAPQFTVPPGAVETQTTYDMTPADFNQVYNVKPLWNKGNRGAGQTVVLLERTNINLDDVAAFRKAFLPADATGTVSIVHPNDAANDDSCQDPGITGDEGEAALDVEWAGAAAPDANIVLASCADVGANFGPLLAANLYQQDGEHGLPPSAPPILSLSYGACELNDANDANLADILWSSLAAQGATVFVSTGDAGSAGCDQGALFGATYGPAANGMASSPSAVAVGGTDFNDLGKTSQYWSSTNQAFYQSAISYIPEQTWNNSCASSTLYTLLGYADGVTACNDSVGRGQDFLQIGGGGGGASFIHGQPEWQEGIYGSTNHLQRTIPDVSLFSANGIFGHALVYCMSDANEGGTTCDYSNPDDVFFNSAGGTSFAAPTMAGVQALINQAIGDRSGNILPAFYNIGAKEYGTNGAPNTAMLAACNSSNGTNEGSSCVFNDVTVGDIVQPCFSGSLGCYSGSGTLTNGFGITEGGNGSSQTLSPAWQTNAGYDQATGLGSVNVTNLVNAVVSYNQPLQKAGYVAPADYLSLNSVFSNDGYSDIALVDPAKGTFSSVAMKGNVMLYSLPLQVSKGYTIGAIGALTPSYDLLGLKVDDLAWTGPDHRVYLWASTAIGGYFPMAFETTYPAGWQLIGSAVADSSGEQQLFWFNSTTAQFGWWKTDLSLETGLPVATISPSTTVTQGYNPTLADVDGDGYADIVWTTAADDSVYVWINDRNGGFVKHAIANHAPGFVLFGAGDVNGDGTTDLIWTNASTNQMSWWTMDGFAVTGQQTRGIAAGYTLASIADYDGDGRADILWVGTAGDVYDWQSTGTGFQSLRVADAFGTPLTIPAGTQVQANRLQGRAIAGHH